MAVFPQNSRIRPQEGYDATPLENVVRTSPMAGNSVTLDHWGRTRFQARPEFRLEEQWMSLLWSFWETNRNVSFTYYDYPSMPRTEALGVATGGVQTLTVAGREVRDVVLTAAGAPIGYTITAGTGPQLEDQLHILAGVAAPGAALAASWMGRRRFTCEFYETPLLRFVGWRLASIVMAIRERF